MLRTFRKHVRLDYSRLQELVLRVGDESLLAVSPDPREAQRTFAAFETLDEQGDGLRSFAAVIAALSAIRRPVTIIDEPEVFLHPPQAFAAGQMLAQAARPRRQIIIATHSPDLLRGVLSGNAKMTLVRLDRLGATNRATILSPDDLRGIMGDPILASSRTLEGLFYNSAIITENAAAQAFYLHLAARTTGVEGTYFAHAHDEQTLTRILSPYTRLGVRSAAVVDLEILRDGAGFAALLAAMQVPAAAASELAAAREALAPRLGGMPAPARLAALRTALASPPAAADDDAEAGVAALAAFAARIGREADAWKAVRERGIAALAEAEPELSAFIGACEPHGIFVAPVAGLQSWLVEHGLPAEGDEPAWVIRALRLIDELPVTPQAGPWSFVARVRAYLNPAD